MFVLCVACLDSICELFVETYLWLCVRCLGRYKGACPVPTASCRACAKAVAAPCIMNKKTL